MGDLCIAEEKAASEVCRAWYEWERTARAYVFAFEGRCRVSDGGNRSYPFLL